MCEIWNELDIKKPPLITLPCNNAPLVQKLRIALNRYDKKFVPLNTEFAQTAALLSRLIARRKNSFRRMSGFHSICKINAALCRLLRVDLSRDFLRFSGALPDTVFEDDVCLEIPNRNSFEYLLVRILGVYHIHARIRNCCTDAADYVAKLLRTHYFFEINTLLLATMGKLFSISGILGNLCVALYNEIQPLRKNMPHRGNYEFLTEQTVLPSKLEMLTAGCKSLEQTNLEHKANSLDCSPSSSKTTAPVIPKYKQKSDIGTEVSRAPKPVKFNIESLASVEEIKRFIAMENKARKESFQKCQTKNILNHEWMGAQKLFEKKLNSNEHKKAFNIFKKFITSKI